MKKILLTALLLAIIIISSAAAAAYAETAEEKANSIAQSCEKVVKSECVIYKRVCVIALQTKDFNAKSDYDAFVNELTANIKAECQADYVFVTRSPKIMSKITELNKMDETDRAKAIEEIIRKELDRRPIKPIMPRMLDNAN